MSPDVILSNAEAWRWGIGGIIALLLLAMFGGLVYVLVGMLRAGLDKVIVAHEAAIARILEGMTALQDGQQRHALDLAEIRGRLFASPREKKL